MPVATLGLWTIGWAEVLVIFAVLLIVFGRRLPETMRNLGRSLNEFKRGMRESAEDVANEVKSDQPSATEKPGEGRSAK